MTGRTEGAFSDQDSPPVSVFWLEQASFVKWYCATHNKKPAAKRPAEAAAAAPPAKKAATQALLPGATAAAAPAMAASKAKALLKGIVTSAKAAAKAKRWHHGDGGELTGVTQLESPHRPLVAAVSSHALG